MKKYLSIFLALCLALSLSLGRLSALGAASVVPFSEDLNSDSGDPASNPGGGDTDGGGTGGDTPVDPPVEPSTSTDPSSPSTEPSAPTDPSSPSTEPSAPTDPSSPSTEPSTPTDPSSPSTEPTAPTDPSKPTAPTTPTYPPTVAPTAPPSSGVPVITKNPTSENVREDGYAEFVARAESCLDVIWHLQNPGGSIDILASKAPEQFPGLVVTGLNSERLGLNHIPKALNEWRVRAEFVGRDGNIWSDPAIINVMSQELAAPTIQQQPASANLKATEGTTLRVGAMTSEQNATLTYQWYKNTINSNVGGKAILGATAASFTPDYIPGTTYYYCAVRSTTGSEISVATKTNCAAVTYVTTAGQDATVPTQQVTVPASDPSAATLAPWDQATVPATEETMPQVISNAPARSNTLLLIVVIVIVVIAVLGIIAAVLILKFYPGRDRDEAQEERTHSKRKENRRSQDISEDDEWEDRTPPRPSAPAPRTGGKFAAKRPSVEENPFQSMGGQPADDAWDDLSDLGDLSIYLDDEDK